MRIARSQGESLAAEARVVEFERELALLVKGPAACEAPSAEYFKQSASRGESGARVSVLEVKVSR